MTTGGWYGLLAILRTNEFEVSYWKHRIPVSCPNDGEPLTPSPIPGELFCKFDGWTYPRDWADF